ncbi:SET domain-containing protein-lysine N-methyltransferase [Variovorax sp. J22R133]|uniref:SET domain-containing protein n=1 Tax=Variovorax brevis TaxID=3053503 RepID=UPI00257518DE|nr:SET domain-containing protein-lysine N-methyltransferase [Variovorax sp. J22R133]MDM0117272.1 SET domain-containing protein-lysine N-methyltransferase [Variovorax sp. J22R133]
MNIGAPFLDVACSGVHGLGTFVTRDLPARAFLGIYRGRRYSAEQLAQRRWDDALTFLFSLSNGETIDGSRGGNATRHINHSCDPNCEAVEEFNSRGRLVLKIYALRSLGAGEEVFLDYALVVDESANASDYRCLCGSPSCRGSMVSPLHPQVRPGSRTGI